MAAASAVGVFAVAVSAVGSWVPSLWGDEAASLLSATRPLGSLLHMLTRVDAVHGLSYIMLHGWIRVFGSSPFAVRFPSAVAVGVCAASAVWMCGRFGRLPFAVTAGLVVAILPRLTAEGEEARSYPFDAALATVLCAVVVEIMLRERVSRRWWVAYGVVLSVGIYAFLYIVLMIPAVAAVIALTPAMRAQWRRFATASGYAVLAASPVIAAAVIEHNQIAFLADRVDATVHGVWVNMWFWTTPVAVVGWLLVAVAAAGWVVDVVQARRSGKPLGRRLETVAFAWMIVPTGLLLLSNRVVPDYSPRYGTFAAPAVAIAMAMGLRRLAGSRRHGVLRAAAVAAAATTLVATVVPVWVAQRGPYAKDGSDWNEVAAAVARDTRAGDGIVFDESARPSRSPRLAMDTDPAPFRGLRDVTLRTPYTRSALWYGSAYGIRQAAARGHFDGLDRVWLVETAYGGTPSTWGRRQMRVLGYRVVRTVRLHSSELVLYAR